MGSAANVTTVETESASGSAEENSNTERSVIENNSILTSGNENSEEGDKQNESSDSKNNPDVEEIKLYDKHNPEKHGHRIYLR